MKANLDKVIHFFIWYSLTLSIALLWGIIPAFVAGMMAAIGKEVYDYIDYGWDYDFSVFLGMAAGDIAADVIAIMIAIDLFTFASF